MISRLLSRIVLLHYRRCSMLVYLLLWIVIFYSTSRYLFGRGFNQYVHTVSVIYTILSAWFDLTKIIWVFASTQSFMCYVVQTHLVLYILDSCFLDDKRTPLYFHVRWDCLFCYIFTTMSPKEKHCARPSNKQLWNSKHQCMSTNA